MALCLAAVASAFAQSSAILTFEDSNYVGGVENYLHHTSDFWSSLIDSPQYGGDLLYGENHGDTAVVYTSTNYKWYDKGNTYLYHELPENYGVTMYWGGGHAISNYWDGNLSHGDYLHQLSVYVPDSISSSGQGGQGHNGSDNFCVHFGYSDNSGYSAPNLPYVTFGDGTARYIDSMWINNTVYMVNCMLNGNSLTTPLSDDDYVDIIAKGYDGNTLLFTKTFPLVNDDGTVVTTWTKWDWNEDNITNPNQPITKVTFNMESEVNNGYGFSLPAYFAYDDVTVRTPSLNNRMAKASRKKAEESNDKYFSVIVKTAFDDDHNQYFYGETEGDVPDDFEFEYVSESTMPNQLEAGQKATMTMTGLSEGTKITALKAAVGTPSTRGGAGKIIAAIDGTDVADIAWYASGMKNLTNDYGTSVSSSAELDFNFYESTPVDCNEKIELKIENVNVSEKESYNKAISIGKIFVYYNIDGTTGIDEQVNAKVKSSDYYTLQGVRVAQPTKGGIYVKNGKKMLMK